MRVRRRRATRPDEEEEEEEEVVDVILFLGGDVMTGRGVDQILPHPGDPTLWETYVKDAGDYVRLAEAANGPVPRPVDFGWPWGAGLKILDQLGAALRLVIIEWGLTT